MPSLRTSAILAFLFFLSGLDNAFAYIDPGSGSVITSAILGFFAAIAYTFRKYFYKAKDILLGHGKTASEEGDGDESR